MRKKVSMVSIKVLHHETSKADSCGVSGALMIQAFSSLFRS